MGTQGEGGLFYFRLLVPEDTIRIIFTEYISSETTQAERAERGT